MTLKKFEFYHLTFSNFPTYQLNTAVFFALLHQCFYLEKQSL